VGRALDRFPTAFAPLVHKKVQLFRTEGYDFPFHFEISALGFFF